MTINKNSSEIITEQQAIDFTHAFQENNPNAIKAFFAGSNKINQILEQDDCIGIRIYNGYNNDTQENNLVLVGVDRTGEDITSGVILEYLIPCPKHCAEDSSLIKP